MGFFNSFKRFHAAKLSNHPGVVRFGPVVGFRHIAGLEEERYAMDLKINHITFVKKNVAFCLLLQDLRYHAVQLIHLTHFTVPCPTKQLINQRNQEINKEASKQRWSHLVDDAHA